MKVLTGIPTLCVSQTLMMGWCDEKVADVVWAVAQEKDLSLYEVLVQATIEGGLFRNFLPLPFTKHSSYGQRLVSAWDVVKKTYPDSETAQTFVWKFWQPLPDSANAHLLHDVLGEAWMLPVDARTRAFKAAGVQFH